MNIKNEDWLYWVSLKDVRGVGDVLMKNLVQKFGSPKEVFSASRSSLLQTKGVNVNTVSEIKNYSKFDDARKMIEKLKKYGFSLITFQDDEYPKNLETIYSPPTFFYMSGNISPNDNLAIAVVGSRDCDDYGRATTERLVREFVNIGITVISGMARGIDTVAHKTAVASGGRTIAVLGNGINIVYPPENKKLYRDVTEIGALITEFGLDVKPDSVNFPKRNRLISGLSCGVLVVQASRKSGALITASYSNEQNRETFAIPGNINNLKSSGANYLIKKGAKLVDSVDDVLEEIDSFRNLITKENKKSKLLVSDDEKKVLEILSSEKLHVDQIISELKQPSGYILSLLLEMEIKGLIAQLPGKFFQIY